MIQIKETDFMWKCYCRTYQDEKETPPPGNLCNYFWTSVWGMGIKFFYDSNFLLAVLTLCGLFYLQSVTFNFMAEASSFTQGIALFEFFMFFIAVIVFGCVRTFKYLMPIMEKIPEKVLAKIAGVFVLGIFGFFIVAMARAFTSPDFNWTEFFQALGFGVLAMFVVFVICVLWAPISSLNFVKTLGAFLKAKKDRVCPLVLPPGVKNE